MSGGFKPRRKTGSVGRICWNEAGVGSMVENYSSHTRAVWNLVVPVVCMGVLLACVSVYQVHAVPEEARRGQHHCLAW